MWQVPATAPSLAVGSVQLWQARGVAAPVALDEYAALLTPGEMARAARFATDTLRRRYVQAHALLHTLLRAALYHASLPPEFPTYEVAQAIHGKPYLAAPALRPPLYFNMSHSGEMVLIALARGIDVGVDVEEVRPLDNLAGLMAASCSVREQAYLVALPDQERLVMFYKLWTRKEAWLKLRGVGLQGALASVEVYPHGAGVTLLDVPVADGVVPSDSGRYVAALALPDSPVTPVVTYHVAQWQAT